MADEEEPDFGDAARFRTAKHLGSLTVQKGPTDTFKRANGGSVELSKAELVRLLGYLEGELQGRDVAIATLKSEAAKALLYQAKYGRLGLNDPLAACQRDSAALGDQRDFDESSVGGMYESQLVSLEKLISVQRRAHQRAKQTLAAAERRHARTIRELESEKARKVADAAQGDDVCALLEKDRERLARLLTAAEADSASQAAAVEKAAERLSAEKERHKAIVLHLLNDRKALIAKLAEAKAAGPSAAPAPAVAPEVGRLSAEIGRLREARTGLEQELAKEREETASLREIVRTQEEDLSLIRHNILAKTRQMAVQKSSSRSPTNSASPPIPAQSPTNTRVQHAAKLNAASNTPKHPRPLNSGVSVSSSGGSLKQMGNSGSSSHVQQFSSLRSSSRILSSPAAVVAPRSSVTPAFPVAPGDHNPPRPAHPPPAYAGSPVQETPVDPPGYRAAKGRRQPSSPSTPPSSSSSSSSPHQMLIEPEIAHLEAVINSLGRDQNGAPGMSPGSTPMPLRKANGVGNQQQHQHVGRPKQRQPSPGPRRSQLPSSLAFRRASNPEVVPQRRYPTPVPAFRAPLPPSEPPPPDAPTGTMKRNSFSAIVGKAIGVGAPIRARVKKKATQV